jgi:predicted metal-dependent peptidase
MSGQDFMQTAKGRLALFAGYWIAIGSKLVWVATDTLPDGSHLAVAATDARKVYYNLDDINQRTVGQAIFIALHEIGHNMLCHLVRMNPSYDRQSWGWPWTTHWMNC